MISILVILYILTSLVATSLNFYIIGLEEENGIYWPIYRQILSHCICLIPFFNCVIISLAILYLRGKI